MLRPIVALSGFFLLSACGAEHVTTVDARFSTPEHTVSTLLGTYGLEHASQDEIRLRITEHGAFELQDRATWILCFTDLERPGGEGLAGYVFGLLAAARDDLRFETVGERAHVFPRHDVRVVMLRGDDLAYRITLGESVPENIRSSLIQVEENAERARRP